MEDRLKLGELLVRAGLVAQTQLDEVLAIQAAHGGKLGALLVAQGLLSETQVTQILSQQLSVPWVSLQHISFSNELLQRVPVEIAKRFTLVPIFIRRTRREGETLYVAMQDPVDEAALNEVRIAAGLPVRPMIAASTDIQKALDSAYGLQDEPTRLSSEYVETGPCSSMVPSMLLESAPPSSLSFEPAQSVREVAEALAPVLALILADGTRAPLASHSDAVEKHLQKLCASRGESADAVDWRQVSTSLLIWLEDRKLISGWELYQEVPLAG